jgi:hypothetical protein
MGVTTLMKPKENDYAPFYAGYIKNVSDNVIKTLEDNLHSTNSFLKSIPEDKADYRYAEGKWCIKELTGHLIDTERVMAYRALAIARKESQHLPGFDEKDYIRESNYSSRNFNELIEELRFIRVGNLLMFRNFSEEVLERRGVANNSEITVRAVLFIIAGHELHHINVLKGRYLNTH